MASTLSEARSDSGTPGPFAGYRGGEEMPIGAYASLLVVHLVALGTLLAVGKRRLPRRIGVGDIALLAVATHKLSRTIARDRVTSPLRAPFTEFGGTGGAGSVEEEPRGRGLRRAIGDLLTCQYCIAPWVATGLGAAYVVHPRVARTLASLFAVTTGADFLHQLYAAVRKLSR